MPKYLLKYLLKYLPKYLLMFAGNGFAAKYGRERAVGMAGGGERACVINGWGRPAEEGEFGSGAALPRHILTR
ncbi:MAG: hypothetical protein BHW56_02245 [Acetobacter sp. 46_36]|nr:MAG: hypothetical protein BHW56_02245 [Acetobacter sp. 46_36]